MKRQTLNRAVSHVYQPTGVGNRRGERSQDSKKDPLEVLGLGSSAYQWATPGYPENAKQFFVWMNVWLNLSLLGGWCISFMFIPIEGNDSQFDKIIFFRWVGSTTN